MHARCHCQGTNQKCWNPSDWRDEVSIKYCQACNISASKRPNMSGCKTQHYTDLYTNFPVQEQRHT